MKPETHAAFFEIIRGVRGLSHQQQYRDNGQLEFVQRAQRIFEQIDDGFTLPLAEKFPQDNPGLPVFADDPENIIRAFETDAFLRQFLDVFDFRRRYPQKFFDHLGGGSVHQRLRDNIILLHPGAAPFSRAIIRQIYVLPPCAETAQAVKQ